MRLWLVSLALLASACSMPHEIFRWRHIDNLVTICHGWDEDTSRTMMFAETMARRHLKHHKLDYLGECQ